MYILDSIDRFQFNNHGIFDEKIQSEPFFMNLDTAIEDRYCNFISKFLTLA